MLKKNKVDGNYLLNKSMEFKEKNIFKILTILMRKNNWFFQVYMVNSI